MQPRMIEATLSAHTECVRDEWTTAGHLDIAGFMRLFDRATDALREHLGIGGRYAETMQRGVVVAESHCTYLREARANDVLRFGTWLLGVADKRMHVFHEMRREPELQLVATSELMLVHIDRVGGATVALPSHVRAAAESCVALHDKTRLPPQIGRSISRLGAGE